jgi:hypothetical protein
MIIAVWRTKDRRGCELSQVVRDSVDRPGRITLDLCSLWSAGERGIDNTNGGLTYMYLVDCAVERLCQKRSHSGLRREESEENFKLSWTTLHRCANGQDSTIRVFDVSFTWMSTTTLGYINLMYDRSDAWGPEASVPALCRGYTRRFSYIYHLFMPYQIVYLLPDSHQWDLSLGMTVEFGTKRRERERERERERAPS